MTGHFRLNVIVFFVMNTARVVCEDIHVRQVVFKMATFIVNRIFGSNKDGFRKFSLLFGILKCG